MGAYLQCGRSIKLKILINGVDYRLLLVCAKDQRNIRVLDHFNSTSTCYRQIIKHDQSHERCMLQLIAEQKMALAAYSSELGLTQLSSYQFELVIKITAALNPVEEITKYTIFLLFSGINNKFEPATKAGIVRVEDGEGEKAG